MAIKHMPFDIVKKVYSDAFEIMKRSTHKDAIELARYHLANKVEGTRWDREHLLALASGNYEKYDDFAATYIINMKAMMQKISEDEAQKFSTISSFQVHVRNEFCPAFHFEDSSLLDEIFRSKMDKMPYSSFKTPGKSLLITCSKRLSRLDGSEDKFDVMWVMNREVGDLSNSGNMVTMVAILLFDTSDIQTVSYITLPVNEETQDFNTEGIDSLGMRQVSMAYKAICFINSQSADIRTINRPNKIKLDEKKSKEFYITYQVVEFKKDERRYEYEDNTPSGRHVSVRHPVIGHFKHFTKGLMAGKVIWCPPHWRGPILAPIKTRDYIINKEANDVQL